MKTVYIYISDGDMEFYLTTRKLTSVDFGTDVPYEEEDVLAGFFDDERDLARKLRFLFELGYELAPTMYYDEIKGRYCPPHLRMRELDRYEPGSDEYLIHEMRIRKDEETLWAEYGYMDEVL